MEGRDDTEPTIVTTEIISPLVTNVIISNNKRQSEPDDIDDSDELRIIKTIPGSQRTARGTSSTESKRSG